MKRIEKIAKEFEIEKIFPRGELVAKVDVEDCCEKSSKFEGKKRGKLVLVTAMTIVLEYSTGPEIHQVKVPNLLSLREATALEKLQENGLVGVKIEEFNADVTRGRVFQQNPDPDTLVEEGTEVTFYISLGPEPEDEPTQPTIPTETGPIGGGTTIPGGEGNTGDEGPEDGEQGNPDDSEGVTVSG